MEVLRHEEQPFEDWRPGVATRMCVSAIVGSRSLCIFEQRCDPGLGAPTHRHRVEEVLEVVAGIAEVWLGHERALVAAHQSVVIPAGLDHGFRNAGPETLHVRATLAAASFEASYDDASEPSRRWTAQVVR